MYYEEAVEDLRNHPGKKIFWKCGYAAGEHEISRDPGKYPVVKWKCNNFNVKKVTISSWEDELKCCFDWACCVDCDSNTETEMHLNGFSENDMW